MSIRKIKAEFRVFYRQETSPLKSLDYRKEKLKGDVISNFDVNEPVHLEEVMTVKGFHPQYDKWLFGLLKVPERLLPKTLRATKKCKNSLPVIFRSN